VALGLIRGSAEGRFSYSYLIFKQRGELAIKRWPLNGAVLVISIG